MNSDDKFKDSQQDERQKLISELEQLEELIDEPGLELDNNLLTSPLALESQQDAESNTDFDGIGKTENIESESIDPWEDVPVLEDMVQVSPVVGHEREEMEEPPLPSTETMSESEQHEHWEVESEESAASDSRIAEAAEAAVDMLDKAMLERTGRSIPADVSDDIWQLLYDALQREINSS